MVWKFSRFTRKREHAVAFKSMLRRRGIRVTSITEHADDSPTGKLMEAIIESVDEFYSANLAEEVSRGMREAASRGFWVATFAPYGYRKVYVQDGAKKRPKLELDPPADAVVKRVFDMALQGKSSLDITKTLNAEGGSRAAQALGVSYRTVSRAVESSRLTERMTAALERHLLRGGGSAAAQQREQVEALEKGLAELAEELRAGVKSVVEEVEAHREEHARGMRHVERRLVALESGRTRAETPLPTAPEPNSMRRYVPPRAYPQLVTREAEEGEENVYGDATPVIVEWRRVRDDFRESARTGTTLAKTEAQERMLTLEIALIEKHGLTLPPASYPWDQSDRRDRLWERERSLDRVRVERNRALLRRWLRRVLTFGLWRD